MSAKSKVQYASAVMLILSSIVLAFIQVLDIETIARGTLLYIAQAFLLAGSIFGLEYYISHMINIIGDGRTQTTTDTKRHPKQ